MTYRQNKGQSTTRAPVKYSESTKCTKFTKVKVGDMKAIFVSFVSFVDQESRILDRCSRAGIRGQGSGAIQRSDALRQQCPGSTLLLSAVRSKRSTGCCSPVRRKPNHSYS